MARKKDEIRNENIIVRVSVEEKKIIAEKAKKQQISLSKYIRSCALELNFNSKTDIQTVFELKKIGVNLNQLAKYVHTHPSDENVQSMINRLHDFFNEVDKITTNLL